MCFLSSGSRVRILPGAPASKHVVRMQWPCLPSNSTLVSPGPGTLQLRAAGLRRIYLLSLLRSGAWSRRLSEWRLAAGLVGDVELAVKVVAEQPQQVFAVVEFDAEALGFLAGG